MIRVAAETEVRGLAQSIVSELDKSDSVQVQAIGKDANYVTIKAIASAGAMQGYELPHTTKWVTGAGRNKEKSSLVYTIHR